MGAPSQEGERTLSPRPPKSLVFCKLRVTVLGKAEVQEGARGLESVARTGGCVLKAGVVRALRRGTGLLRGQTRREVSEQVRMQGGAPCTPSRVRRRAQWSPP